MPSYIKPSNDHFPSLEIVVKELFSITFKPFPHQVMDNVADVCLRETSRQGTQCSGLVEDESWICEYLSS